MMGRGYGAESWRLLARLLAWEGPDLEMTLRGLPAPYERFTLPKGGGGERVIEAPHPTLKRVQRAILQQLLYKVPTPPDIHGFVPGRSIVTQARQHSSQQELINFDIADAFPSISRDRVLRALTWRLGSQLKHRGPRLNRREREGLFELLADLTTWEGRLPQGAPTSGALLNLALMPLDRDLRLALRAWERKGWRGLVYTRYADDLTLSARDDLPPDAPELLRRVIRQRGLRYNGRKVHRADQRLGQALVVCGIHVDGDRLRLPRKALRRLRAAFHAAYCEPALDAEARGRVEGQLGLLLMVYGEVPSALRKPFALLAARHGVAPRIAEREGLATGYGGWL